MGTVDPPAGNKNEEQLIAPLNVSEKETEKSCVQDLPNITQ